MKKKKIRLWKLGDHKEKILPTSETMDALANAIRELHTDDNCMDLIWDSLLTVETYKIDEDMIEIVVKDLEELGAIIQKINKLKVITPLSAPSPTTKLSSGDIIKGG